MSSPPLLVFCDDGAEEREVFPSVLADSEDNGVVVRDEVDAVVELEPDDEPRLDDGPEASETREKYFSSISGRGKKGLSELQHSDPQRPPS